LVFIFTLRNANRIPPSPGRLWQISEQHVIPFIGHIKKTTMEQDQFSLVRGSHVHEIAPTFRAPELRIAIVGICAYPDDHPLALKDITPGNREAYAERHGYQSRMHTEPPVIGGNIQIQHAKLATMLHYILSGDFDWVVWFDCDSIIMNHHRTLDSIIYQYAQVPRSVTGRNLTGNWSDTWAPHDAPIEIFHSINGSLLARAPQIGQVSGQVVDVDVEVAFTSGALKAQFQEAPDGLALQWENGAVWYRVSRDREDGGGCLSVDDCPGLALDPEIDLFITEEGWGLSSANWMIRRSAWSVSFLQRALDVAHVEMPLFGDQDAIIYLLLNQQALTAAAMGCEETRRQEMCDPLDHHAVIVPQFELNSYDQLNALTMDCDGFDGYAFQRRVPDLLITFPQCKDPDYCNDLFRAADEYSQMNLRGETLPHEGSNWVHLRVFGPLDAVRQLYNQQRAEEEEY